MSSADLLPRSFGAYTLLKLLARGGMGEIFLARGAGAMTGFEKYYAVKRLLKKFAQDDDVGARFIDEAKLGGRLQHPNIVQVYDLGRVNEELFMAAEFVDGFDLRRVLRFCHEKKKRIPLDIALFVVREILSGLAYAHRQVDAAGASINLIHRDISPQNVLVSFEGEVKIIDFGLAKSTQRSQETQANVLLGNFGYMSPEQARGQPLDPRTDIYSTGIVLFELVTGTKRFVEENPLKLLEMVARPTPITPSDRVPGAPRAIDRMYAKATALAREERHASAEAFRDDVTAALYKLNPRASRESLAQFLNHLFLGGQAPPSVDADILNRSMAVQVRDLYGLTEAFLATPEADVKNRALSAFSDDAPQTASHPILRDARVGDLLSHEEITGFVSSPEAAAPDKAASQSPPADAGDAADIPVLDMADVALLPIDSSKRFDTRTDGLEPHAPPPPTHPTGVSSGLAQHRDDDESSQEPTVDEALGEAPSSVEVALLADLVPESLGQGNIHPAPPKPSSSPATKTPPPVVLEPAPVDLLVARDTGMALSFVPQIDIADVRSQVDVAPGPRDAAGSLAAQPGDTDVYGGSAGRPFTSAFNEAPSSPTGQRAEFAAVPLALEPLPLDPDALQPLGEPYPVSTVTLPPPRALAAQPPSIVVDPELELIENTLVASPSGLGAPTVPSGDFEHFSPFADGAGESLIVDFETFEQTRPEVQTAPSSTQAPAVIAGPLAPGPHSPATVPHGSPRLVSLSEQPAEQPVEPPAEQPLEQPPEQGIRPAARPAMKMPAAGVLTARPRRPVEEVQPPKVRR